jgi:type IV pilus assembly protein PilC
VFWLSYHVTVCNEKTYNERMPIYSYTARDSLGNLVRGEEDVDTPDALVVALQRKQLYPTKISRKSQLLNPNAEVELPKWLGGDQVNKKEKTVFTRQLGTLMKAGVSLVSALDALEQQAKTGAMRRLIRNVRERIEVGTPVGEAFADYEGQFGELYVNLVRAGDLTGTLPETMQNLSEHLERAGQIAGKIKSALTYPGVVFAIAIGIAGFLLTNIVPIFAEILLDLEAELPQITVVTLAISDFIRTKPIQLVGGIVGVVAFFYFTYRNESGRYVYHWLFARTPVVKLIFNGSSIATFASGFAVALRSGLPILDALEVSQKIIGNRVMKYSLDRVRADVERGEPVSRSMSDFPGVYPSIFISMLRSGEDSGNVETMVTHAQEYYQNEVDLIVENLTSLIEPIMIVVLGGLIAVITLSLFLPLWGALGAMAA